MSNPYFWATLFASTLKCNASQKFEFSEIRFASFLKQHRSINMKESFADEITEVHLIK